MDNGTKDNKQTKNKNTTAKLLCILSSLCILLSLYSKFNKNKSSKSNVFSDNTISISNEEVDTICSDLEKMLDVDIPEEEKDEYLVLNSIRENDEFGEYKWWFCEQIINIIKDNSYLNKEDVYKSLLNVKISYDNNDKSIDGDSEGRYNYFLNNVEIFSGYPSLEVCFHEIIHCIYNTQKLPRFFKEGMTELLTNEYLIYNEIPFKETKSYPFEVSAVKMLCELTSPDIVLKAFTFGDMNYIIGEISSVTGNKEEVETALAMMGDALDAFQKRKDYDLKKFNENCINLFQKCIDAKYKYGEYNYESYYYNEMLFYNCLFKESAKLNYDRDIELYGIDYKAYFSSNLKAKIKSGKFVQMQEENDMQKRMSLYD